MLRNIAGSHGPNTSTGSNVEASLWILCDWCHVELTAHHDVEDMMTV